MRNSLSSATSSPVPTKDPLLGDPQESLTSLLLQQSMLVLCRGDDSGASVTELCGITAQGSVSRAAAQGHCCVRAG